MPTQDDFSIIAENIFTTKEKILNAGEVRSANADEAGRMLASLFSDNDNFYGNQKMLSAFYDFSQRLSNGVYIPKETVDKAYAQTVLGSVQNIDLFRIASGTYDCISSKSSIQPECFFELEKAPAKTGEVLFVDNPLTEQAFKKLCGHFTNLYKNTADDFESVCSGVESSESEYCLLPIENSRDGNLSNFTRMIRDYGLKKCMVIDLKSDDESYTKYALLRKNILPILHTNSDKIYADIMIPFNSRREVGIFLSSLSMFNVEAEIISTLPDNFYLNDEYRYSFCLSLKKTNFVRLMFCISLLYPNRFVSGVYSQI